MKHPFLFSLFFVLFFCFVLFFLFFESSLLSIGLIQGHHADLGGIISHEIMTKGAVFKDLMLPHEIQLLSEQRDLGLPIKNKKPM